jgi:hypothetical protein
MRNQSIVSQRKETIVNQRRQLSCERALLPLCALGRIRSASCRCVHCCGQCRSRCQALRSHSHFRWVARVLARFCSFPMCLRGLDRQCGHPAVACLVVAGVVAMVLSGRFVMLPEWQLSRCGSFSRRFRSQTVGLLPLCTLSWLRSLPLSGL